jgi:hypothetical protein
MLLSPLQLPIASLPILATPKVQATWHLESYKIDLAVFVLV